MEKLWLLSTSCSGKSYFAKQQTYRQIKLLDQDDYLGPVCIKTNIMISKYDNFDPKDYGPVLASDIPSIINIYSNSHINTFGKGVCLLTSMDEYLTDYNDIKIKVGAVLIPLYQLIPNIRKRYPTEFQHFHHKIIEYRNHLINHIHQHNIPAYESFEQAIDKVIEKTLN